MSESLPIPPTNKRTSLINLMVDEGCDAEKINVFLESKGFAPLSPDEKVKHGFALPDSVTADDLLSAPSSAIPVENAVVKKPADAVASSGVDCGAVLTKNPLTGKDFTELNAHVVQIAATISHILRASDPKSWAKYKQMKIADSSIAGKMKAYEWAWNHLLQIGYQPTAEG